jgi:hypothetical protein
LSCSARQFSTEPVPRELIEHAIRTAGTAPSGAHQQPWRFVAIDDPRLKQRIREAAEEEEYRTYTQRMSDEWREALAPLGTDWVKAHITPTRSGVGSMGGLGSGWIDLRLDTLEFFFQSIYLHPHQLVMCKGFCSV